MTIFHPSMSGAARVLHAGSEAAAHAVGRAASALSVRSTRCSRLEVNLPQLLNATRELQSEDKLNSL